MAQRTLEHLDPLNSSPVVVLSDRLFERMEGGLLPLDPSTRSALAARDHNAQLPVFSLPAEIYQIILFKACLRTGPNDLYAVTNLAVGEPREGTIFRRARNTVSSVCHHWRELVLDTPSLWSHISVDFTTVTGRKADRTAVTVEHLYPTLSILKLELERAKVPLHMRLVFTSIPSQPMWENVYRLLSAAIPRCESLSAYLARPSWFKDIGFDPNIILDLPHMRTLILRSSAFAAVVENINLSKAPLLQNVSMSGTFYPSHVSKGRRLLRFQVDECLPAVDVPLSSIGTHLQQLSWSMPAAVVLDALGGREAESIPFPALEALCLTVTYPATIAEYTLHRIEAPNLRNLTIVNRTAKAIFPRKNQFPVLESLTMSWDDRTLANGLLNVPSLRVLVLKTTIPCWEGLVGTLLERDLDREGAPFRYAPSLREVTAWIESDRLEELLVERNKKLAEDSFRVFLPDSHGVKELRSGFPMWVKEAVDGPDPFSSELWTMIEA